MMKCVVCRRDFNDQREAERVPCYGGRGHILQERIEDASRNPDTGEEADFRSVDESDLKQWGDKAKKIFGGDE